MIGILPEPRYDHLRTLTGRHGLHEHARGQVPAPGFGYCVDDVARGLILTCLAADERLADLRSLYLTFTIAAVAPDGRCHNRLSTDGHWEDEPALGDWWGRAVWGLGVAATTLPHDGAADALQALETLARRRPNHRRTFAYAALGASRVVARSAEARRLVEDAGTAVARPSDKPGRPDWPWPEARLTYDNAAIPWALLAAGEALGREDWLDQGLAWLTFLVDRQRHAGHLSMVPSGGWGPGDRPPGFDQQPLELASLAVAASLAHTLTGQDRWLGVVRETGEWFAGNNDRGILMVDPDTGAGYDGLTPEGRNLNCGAESTLAANLTLLTAQNPGVHACPPSSPPTQISTSNPTRIG